MTNPNRGPFFSNPFVARAARWGLLAWSVIGILILLWALFRFVLIPIRVIFPPLVVALILIYLLDPVVTRLQRRGMPRVWAALLTYIVFLGAVGVALAYLIPVIARQVQSFVAGIPVLLTRAEAGFAAFGRRKAPPAGITSGGGRGRVLATSSRTTPEAEGGTGRETWSPSVPGNRICHDRRDRARIERPGRVHELEHLGRHSRLDEPAYGPDHHRRVAVADRRLLR